MIYGHYVNKPWILRQIPLTDPMVNLETTVVEEFDSRPDTDTTIAVDCSRYEMVAGGKVYPVAISEKSTQRGNFVVAELWQHPRWKNNGTVYLPGSHNPIGVYLIILADQEGNKIPTSIHAWPRPASDFVQGNYGEGCIRMRAEDMKHVFENTPLGAAFAIHD